MPATSAAPTLLISWSHSEPGWKPDQERQRRDAVLRLAKNLRLSGIDAELDLHQAGGTADWTRWGPAKADSSDFVLIVGSPAWKRAWEGNGDQTKGSGAAAEADVLRSIYARDRTAFLRKLRLVFLPGTPSDVPLGLDGIERYYLADETPEALSGLVRDLSNQPAFPKGPLGKLPSLPPDESWRTSAPAARASTPAPAKGESAEGELRYKDLLEPVTVRWREQWAPRDASSEMAISVHVLASPAQAIPARRLAALNASLVCRVRATGLFQDADALATLDDPEGVTVSGPRDQGFMLEVRPGKLLGVRVDRSGQVSAWHSLPGDGLGNAVDEPSAAAAIKRCLLLVAATEAVPDSYLALAVEISPLTTLSLTDVSTLGHRRTASLQFSFGPNIRTVEPDELVESRALSSGVDEVAATLAGLLLRALGRRQ